jgi:hypothetical protein
VPAVAAVPSIGLRTLRRCEQRRTRGTDGLRTDSTLQVVEASSVKKFGKPHKIPPSAVVHFQGDDPQDGPLL